MFKTQLETHSGQSAREVHRALQLALKSMAEAEKCAVICFGEIMARKLYRELGYGSIHHYAEVELGFSPRRTRDFVALSKKLAELPLLKEEVESGNLGYTAARVIAPIMDETNEKGWVELATTHSRRELEREVKRAKLEAVEVAKGQPTLLPAPKQRPAAVVPVRVSLEMTPTQFARYEGLWEKIRKQGGVPVDQVEALLAVMQSCVEVGGPRGPEKTAAHPPVQIHIHQCDECGKATVQSSRGELEIGAAELEQAQCDCRISRPGVRNSTSIPPATRRSVLANARHKCQRPGCDHTRYLAVHHKVRRAQGGSNDPENLICLCSACHKLLHDMSLSLVKSPPAIYKWRSGAISTGTCPPCRVDTYNPRGSNILLRGNLSSPPSFSRLNFPKLGWIKPVTSVFLKCPGVK